MKPLAKARTHLEAAELALESWECGGDAGLLEAARVHAELADTYASTARAASGIRNDGAIAELVKMLRDKLGSLIGGDPTWTAYTHNGDDMKENLYHVTAGEESVAIQHLGSVPKRPHALNLAANILVAGGFSDAEVSEALRDAGHPAFPPGPITEREIPGDVERRATERETPGPATLLTEVLPPAEPIASPETAADGEVTGGGA